MAKVVLSVVEGLMYLYDVHKIIQRCARSIYDHCRLTFHPDIKPATFSATARAKSNYTTLASLAN